VGQKGMRLGQNSKQYFGNKVSSFPMGEVWTCDAPSEYSSMDAVDLLTKCNTVRRTSTSPAL
jgi:hypothetical protein